MQPTGTPKSQDAALQQLWLQVCASRGTPAPDAAERGRFLQALGVDERRVLESVLALAARGREKPGDLGLLSWAAACTRPSLLGQLKSHGLAFSSAHLFACGLALMQDGWDMPQRLAQLGSNLQDVDTLRAWLPVGPETNPQALAAPDSQAAVDEASYPWPDDGPPNGSAPGWQGEPMDPMDESPAAPASSRAEVLPSLPTRFERQPPEPFPAASSAANAGRPMDESRLRLRLFGKAAAHTLEVTPHRRGGDFMGVHDIVRFC